MIGGDERLSVGLSVEQTANSKNSDDPRHIAIIMDGNGRWAKKRNLPRTAGHKKGIEAVKQVMDVCRDVQVHYITLYAFSAENWNRSETEVDSLMELLRYYLKHELKSLHKEGVRLRVIGDRSLLAEDIKQNIIDAEQLTEDNVRLNLMIALSYGARQEIAYALRCISEGIKQGVIDTDQVNEGLISEYLYTKNIPDPDLLIRTGGETRLSNFLLWQSAYTELMFLDVLWPDFTKDDLLDAISQYHKRERRYGTS